MANTNSDSQSDEICQVPTVSEQKQLHLKIAN